MLLSSAENQQDGDDEDEECDASEEAPEESRRPANSLRSAYRLLTPSVKVCMFLRYHFYLVWTSRSCLCVFVLVHIASFMNLLGSCYPPSGFYSLMDI